MSGSVPEPAPPQAAVATTPRRVQLALFTLRILFNNLSSMRKFFHVARILGLSLVN